MTILVTGGSGFSGRHLVRLLARNKRDRIVSTFLTHRSVKFPPGIRQVRVNLAVRSSIARVVKAYRPKEIYHVASLVKRTRGPARLDDLFRSNIIGTAHLLDAVRMFTPRARIVNVGSSYEYGKVARTRMPIREHEKLCPHTAYALSKVGQERVAEYYARTYQLHIMYTRTFYYAGPEQPPGFLCSNLITKILRQERLGQPQLTIANPNDRFDYTDIRDVARAYRLIMKRGRVGDVYNVCSGKTYRVKDIVSQMLRLRPRPFRVERIEIPHGPFDMSYYRGSYRKLFAHTGWRPARRMADTVADMLKDRLS